MAQRKIIGVRMESHVEEYTEELETKVHAWLEACGMDASSTTQNIISSIPLVDTGRLKNSIYPIVPADEHTAYIGTNVEYAKYHELGTSKLPARHFLQAGVTLHQDSYKSLLEDALKE